MNENKFIFNTDKMFERTASHQFDKYKDKYARGK